MNRCRICIAATLLALTLLGGQATAAGGAILVDGRALEHVGQRIINNTTYVPLRTVTQALRGDAQILWQGGRAVAQAPDLMLTARPGDDYIEANGRCLYVRDGVRLENGCTLVPVRTLAQAMDATVAWDGASGTVSITSGSGAAPGASYSGDDLYWLSRIISAESQGESMMGKIAVGNVVLNRVKSKTFPNTIYGVIFDGSYGGQFEPVRNGAIYWPPTAESVAAAKLCLEGASVAGESFYFLAPALTGNHWIMENRPFVTTIGCHWFYR